jgi:DNA-binding CsgD family transcriptional regulator
MVALVEAAGLADPGMTPFLADEIEALIALGQLDRAEALVETFADRARSLGRSRANAAAARCRALLLAERGDLIAALSAVGQAIDFHTQGEQMPLELARTLMVKGRIERRLKRKAPARASLERAARISREVGAMLWARRAEAELARIGVRGETGTLTAGEKHVAMLAASGMTNREIAAAAFMSQKTVEAHLSRTYRKLGIHSRAQLALRLADSP